MELPSILPDELRAVATCNSDLELYDHLLRNTDRLVRFFSYAADDETWSGEHQQFHKLVLGWLTSQFLQNRLSDAHAHEVVRSLHDHFPILESQLPRSVALDIGGKNFWINPLLMGVESAFLRDLLRKEGRVIAIDEVDPEIGVYIIRYIETGALGDLWRWSQKEIEAVLKVADRWKISKLQEECQQILGRYVTSENVLELLITAEKRDRRVLMHKCIEVFNAVAVGAQLNFSSKGLTFTFLDFSEKSLQLFDKLKGIITYLVVGGKLSLEPEFEIILGQVPRLMGLDLSGSEELSPYLSSVPMRVQELNLARCGWLNDKNIRQLVQLIPHITILGLSQNSQLTYVGFGEVRKWALKGLDLSRCSQLEDDDLSLILQGLAQLTHLNLLACKKLSDRAFYDLARRGSNLQKLKLGRTAVTDGSLIEIGARCHFLESIALDHCLNISHAGLSSFLKIAAALRLLSIQDTYLEQDSIQQLREQFPHVNIIV